MANVGFTGTREGMSPAQKSSVYLLFEFYFVPMIPVHQLHHGGCLGADCAAHDYTLGSQSKIHVVVHPPTETRLYDSSLKVPAAGITILPPEPYLDRNHSIVESTDLLVAAPATFFEVQRSGTWATIRYARKRHKPIVCVFPDGTYTEEGFHAKSEGVQGRR